MSWLCDKLNIHKRPSVEYFNGHQSEGACPRCEVNIFQTDFRWKKSKNQDMKAIENVRAFHAAVQKDIRGL